jgi:hypothetical protein
VSQTIILKLFAELEFNGGRDITEVVQPIPDRIHRDLEVFCRLGCSILEKPIKKVMESGGPIFKS